MRRVTPIAVFVLCFHFLATPLLSQEETVPPTPAQLAAMERVRPLVDAIWADVRAPEKPGEEHPRYFWDVTDKLIAIGPDVVPFITAELDLMDADTFHFCAYALGRLGGPEAEKALRRAIRAADAGGGRFGKACKRFALYGLGLLGKPDVVDLMLTGGAYEYGITMVPEFPLVAELAMMIGPPAAPLLEKQLETFRADPAAVTRLEDTMLALGFAGDASIVPKIEPLLTSKFPKIRVQAADTISRLGEPRLCEEVLQLLAAADDHERILVATVFERWKPEPCYKAMVGRLEVEGSVPVRRALYNAIVAMGGESSLEVLRLYLGSNNQSDRVLAAQAVGRVGSKKGLNMLRPLLAHEDPMTAVHTMEAIESIGGEGATDTLLAATADRRIAVADAAQEILTRMGVKRVAPRMATELLDIVRKPVVNTNLRPPIIRLSEALVTLGYTDPSEELKAGAAVQSDPKITETLDSCVRRLQLIAKHRDDATAWAAELTSSRPEVMRLAERRIAEIGSPAALRAFTARLARTDLPPEDRASILLAIGQARMQEAAQLVERHLADPVFDSWEYRESRNAAAWAARRLGGDRMIRALRQSALRRDGRDWATLAYLAVLDKAPAAPTLRSLRLARLRYVEPRSGTEARQLDAILADLAAGRELTRFDVPPELLFTLE